MYAIKSSTPPRSYMLSVFPFKRTMSMPDFMSALSVTFPLKRTIFPLTSRVLAVNETACGEVPSSAEM